MKQEFSLNNQSFQLFSSDHFTSRLQFQRFIFGTVPHPPVFVFSSFSNRFMDSLVVVLLLLAWAATHGETMPFTSFESIGNTLLQVVALCNFPAPMKELFDWGNILCHLRTLLPPEIPDNATIQTLCVREYPRSPSAPKPLHLLLRSGARTRTLSVLYTLNALIYNWLEYNMPSDAATVAPLHRGVVEPLYKH